MNKGMFYLLPFLVFTPLTASNALPQAKVASLLNVLEEVRSAETPKMIVTVPKPISGRNMNARRAVKIYKPRAGRNASRLRDRRLLIKRN